jgi:hypothetical protein
MGYAIARLHCAIHFFLVKKKQTLHASTSTPQPPLHGAMEGMWRKKPLPHRNKRQKRLQTKKANAPNCNLVENRKPKTPHKERNQSSFPDYKREGTLAGTVAFQMILLKKAP